MSRGREESEAEEGTRECGRGGGLGGEPPQSQQMEGSPGTGVAWPRPREGKKQALSTENLKQCRTDQSHSALHCHHAILNSVIGKRCLQPGRTLPASPHQLPTHAGVCQHTSSPLHTSTLTARSTRRFSSEWLRFPVWTVRGTQPLSDSSPRLPECCGKFLFASWPPRTAVTLVAQKDHPSISTKKVIKAVRFVGIHRSVFSRNTYVVEDGTFHDPW